MTFNVRSLIETSRRIELNKVLMDSGVDIAFIQETRISSDCDLRLHNFKTVRDSSALGTAIFIRKNIGFRCIEIHDIGFNGCFIELDLTGSSQCRKFLLGSVYIPCNFPAADTIASLDIIRHFSSSYDGTIIGGDLNAKNTSWGDGLTNLNGRSLSEWLGDSGAQFKRICDVNPSFPNGSSFLDHFLKPSRRQDLKKRKRERNEEERARKFFSRSTDVSVLNATGTAAEDDKSSSDDNKDDEEMKCQVKNFEEKMGSDSNDDSDGNNPDEKTMAIGI
ncbi:hypothetical protein CVS40_3143 [Lucilia cuprina]|nr:hypothetical protein CVS40_3143 [Lucilia cuprina]